MFQSLANYTVKKRKKECKTTKFSIQMLAIIIPGHTPNSCILLPLLDLILSL